MGFSKANFRRCRLLCFDGTFGEVGKSPFAVAERNLPEGQLERHFEQELILVC